MPALETVNLNDDKEESADKRRIIELEQLLQDARQEHESALCAMQEAFANQTSSKGLNLSSEVSLEAFKRANEEEKVQMFVKLLEKESETSPKMDNSLQKSQEQTIKDLQKKIKVNRGCF